MEAMISMVERPKFRQAWKIVSPRLEIKNAHDYSQAVAILDELVDEVGDNTRHPLFGFLEVLGTVIESYEEDHVPIKDAPAVEVLRLLMEQHGLTQSDLPEVGSQGVVSEILHESRQLNTRQIKALSQRFGVSPAVFF